MNSGHLIVDLAIIAILIIGISLFRTPKGARLGNLTAAFSLLCSIAAVWIVAPVLDLATVICALMLGGAVGTFVAVKVTMIQIPAMVAFQHGAGGIAAFLVSYMELTQQGGDEMTVGIVSGLAGLVIGAATFSGSMLASAKLANRIRQTPTVLKGHNPILLALFSVIVALAVAAGISEPSARAPWLGTVIFLSVAFGVLFAVRIGGADMPVLISFLNATAGLAAAFCGIIMKNRLLIVSGATVAASGSILTHVMCRAMNRSLANVFVGIQPASRRSDQGTPPAKAPQADALATPAPASSDSGVSAGEKAVKALAEGRRVVIIPGYGMALAQAQFAAADLAKVLERMGKSVSFAIHPVAGRMPGHMNVLLAEADVSYDMLLEMDAVNPRFAETDVALVIGACDVVNPAAIETEGTPISGMPILMAHESKTVIVCNLDERPGYSGVRNPLYDSAGTIMLLGDAKSTLDMFSQGLQTKAGPEPAAPGGGKCSDSDRAARLLSEAGSVVIIPGYGMALAQAQFKVAELAGALQAKGKNVRFAIHPVAGRMPGHMNVLLAEADVPYEILMEMDSINPELPGTDVVIVVGASDVVNPAAIRTEGTPISGMPILAAHEAKHAVVCNLDTKPGYSGVDNPLYAEPNTILLLGDAKETMAALIQKLA